MYVPTFVRITPSFEILSTYIYIYMYSYLHVSLFYHICFSVWAILAYLFVCINPNLIVFTIIMPYSLLNVEKCKQKWF